jgi:leucyl aminopeptidase (aminopeptidase T)
MGLIDDRAARLWRGGRGPRFLAAIVLLALVTIALSSREREPQEQSDRTTPVAVFEKTFPAFDFARWGRFIVRDFFNVQPYEKVVIMAAPSYYPELLDAIRTELLEARAIELGTILFDEREVAARRRALAPRTNDLRYRAETDAARRNLYRQADIFMWLPFRYGTADERTAGDRRELERLVEGTNARGLHFHWVTNPEPFTQEEINDLSRAYADALDIDYAALSAHHDRLIAALSDQVLQITTPAGTNLRVRAGTRFHKGDGVMDRQRAATARAVRDREMELPAGALRFIPAVTTTEGILIVPAWGGGENVRFEFHGGRTPS